MTEELLEKIPVEKRWAITAQILFIFMVLRGEKLSAPQMGMGKDIFSPLWIREKWLEINEKVLGDVAIQGMHMIKEMFKIPVEDAIGAAKLHYVLVTLLYGPEQKWWEIVEATPERAVLRAPNCFAWKRYDEFEIEPEFRPCKTIEERCWPEGFKALNPKLTYKLVKAKYWGDPYCEAVIEFKEE